MSLSDIFPSPIPPAIATTASQSVFVVLPGSLTEALGVNVLDKNSEQYDSSRILRGKGCIGRSMWKRSTPEDFRFSSMTLPDHTGEGIPVGHTLLNTTLMNKKFQAPCKVIRRLSVWNSYTVQAWINTAPNGLCGTDVDIIVTDGEVRTVSTFYPNLLTEDQARVIDQGGLIILQDSAGIPLTMSRLTDATIFNQEQRQDRLTTRSNSGIHALHILEPFKSNGIELAGVEWFEGEHRWLQEEEIEP